MGKQQQQSRNDQGGPGETPTAYGAMLGGADPTRSQGEPHGRERVANRDAAGPDRGFTQGRASDEMADASYAQRSFGAYQGQGAATGGGRPRRWRRSPQAARDVMTRNPKSVRPGDTVQQIAQLMVTEDTGIIPVVEGGRLVGVVTDRDIVCRLVAAGTDVKMAKASDVMTTDVECVTENDSLQEVLEVMGAHQIRRVGVVAKDDRLVGIISMADLAREADVDERLQEAFEEISAERSFWSNMR